jgi:hypothetical protein
MKLDAPPAGCARAGALAAQALSHIASNRETRALMYRAELKLKARRWAAERACVRELRVIEGVGHCPHDEAPERVNPILVGWLTAPGQR